MPWTTSILPHNIWCVNIHFPERIHGDKNQSRIGIDDFLLVSDFDAMQDSGSRRGKEINKSAHFT
jgi:hypothetical protein